MRHLAHRLADLGVRQCEHAVAQRLIAQRQAIEAQHPDHQPQRGAVDEEREQDKAGRQDGDEASYLGSKRRILGDRERQHQRQCSAQPAPDDGELVGAIDRLAEPEPLQQRHEPEQREECGPRKRLRSGRQAGWQSWGADIDEQPRHQDCGEHENQRARPERDLLPKLAQERPI